MIYRHTDGTWRVRWHNIESIWDTEEGARWYLNLKLAH